MKMTIQTISLLAALALSPFAFADHHEKGHEDHEGDKHAEKAGHEDHDHDAHAKKAGPNGGRILHEVEPHAEFFVTKDRKVQITFLGEDGKAVAPGDQKVSGVAGKRSKPTKLKFVKTETGFLSTKGLPAGNNIPTIIIFKIGDKKSRARFNTNLDDCPSCEFKEYACICDHDHKEGEDHKGHDH